MCMCWLDLNIEIKKYTVSDWKRSVNEAVIDIKREKSFKGRGCHWGDNPKKMNICLMGINKIAIAKNNKPMEMQGMMMVMMDMIREFLKVKKIKVVVLRRRKSNT